MKTIHAVFAATTVAVLLAVGAASPAMAAKKPLKTMKANTTAVRVISPCPPGTTRVAIRYPLGTYVPGMPLYDCI